MRVFRVGLTGGIASGKSAVAERFAALGVPVIDTDGIAREVVAPGAPALRELVAAFGNGFVDSSGALDRRRLRAHVFGDEHERRKLEAILHPHIESATLAAADAAGGPYQVIVVPLLIESGFDRQVDRVLVVDCPVEVQRRRLIRRDGEDAAQVERMLASQADRQARLGRAHDVIDNSGPLAELTAKVQDLHRKYLALAREFRAPAS